MLCDISWVSSLIFFYFDFLDDYAIPDVTKSALRVTLPQTKGQTNNLDKPPPKYDALYAAADLLHTQVPNIPSLQVILLIFLSI